MTNVSGTTEKVDLRRKLFQCGIQALENKGWAVSRIPKGGKAELAADRKRRADLQSCDPHDTGHLVRVSEKVRRCGVAHLG